MLLSNVALASRGKIVSDTQYDAYRSYQNANQELRILGFELVQIKRGNYFLMEKVIGGKLYQVQVNLRRKKIIVDIYAFMVHPYRKKYSNFGKDFGKDVSNDIFKAIYYRIKENASLPPISLPALWNAERRDANIIEDL